MKSIKVSERTWEKLMKMKLATKATSMDDLIIDLLITNRQMDELVKAED